MSKLPLTSRDQKERDRTIDDGESPERGIVKIREEHNTLAEA